MHCRTAALSISLLMTLPATARAGEGMYLLDRLPEAWLKRSGLKIPVAKLRELARAVVKVGRGGTGSFVSDKGLVVTNHHVAYGCLVRLNARKGHQGIMHRGYLAQAQADELACPGYYLRALIKVEDVTAQVLKGVKAANRRNYKKRFEQLRQRKEQLRQACEADGKHVCQVAAMDGGTAYYRSTYLRIRDVRLVYAPPRSLGKYGGDVDNWMYPRHTADFTYLRAYVAPDGKAAPHAKKNVPYKPPVHLKVSTHGVKRKSLVLVIGFPGRTSRHRTSHAVRFHSEQKLTRVIEMLGRALTVLEERRKASADARRKYMGLESGLQNAIKYYRMSREGFTKWDVLKRKLAWEQALFSGKGELAGVKAPKLDARSLGQAKKLHAEIGKLYAGWLKHHRRFNALGRLTGWVVPSVRTAHDIVKWSKERHKPDAKRKDGRYKDKNKVLFMEAAGRLEQEIELETEKAMLLFLLRESEKLPRAQRLRSTGRLLAAAAKELARARRQARKQKQDFAAYYKKTYGVAQAKEPLQAAVDMMYGRTEILAHSGEAEEILRAAAARKRLFAAPRKAIARSADPLLAFAREIEAEFSALKDGPFTLVEQYLATVLRPRWVKQYKQAPYPDANFTVRLTAGSVQDYHESATGKTHHYTTDMAGLIKKGKGKYPFLVPPFLSKAHAAKKASRFYDGLIKDVPVNFTTTLDTTGGNSGSPVLDDKGRLVGLLFDGTPESILSDWQYLHKEQRSICMDIRFAHYLAALQGAERMLKELGIESN